MSANGEVEKPAAEQPEVTEKRAVKEKKPKAAPKEKKPKTAKTASHPPYFEMIKEALVALNEKSGSSPHAIAKFMEEKHKAVLPANFRKILGLQLKNSATKGKLIKIKASYKLSDTEKKVKVAAVKPVAKKTAPAKPVAKKPAAVATRKPRKAAVAVATAAGTKRKAESVKKVAMKKGVKKSTPVKAKQPKSIKSPAKRARRGATAA